MNFQADLHRQRKQFPGIQPYPIANYHTGQKYKMKSAFDENPFYNLHLIPEPLKKNLADTLQSTQKDYTEARTDMGMDYSRSSGITNFLSGMFSAVLGAVFRRPRSPDKDWQQANDEYKNGQYPAEANIIMSDCKTVTAGCEDTLARESFFTTKRSPNKYQSRLKKHLLEASSIESSFDSFENALSPEDFELLAKNSIIEYCNVWQCSGSELCEVDAPKIRVEKAPDIKEQSIVPDFHKEPKAVKDMPETTKQMAEPEVNECVPGPNTVVMSCEDKLSKLKEFLQKRRTKEKLQTSADNTPSNPISITQTKDKKYKNPHRLTDKRQKTRLKQDIQEDILFAEEINNSSLKNSPCLHPEFETLECAVNLSVPQNSPDIIKTPVSLDKTEQFEPQDYFDEVSGRFGNASHSSEDSFQIVFTDIPQRVCSTSECDSEDSFIVFEESPDSCYASNDVFGDESDSESDCENILPDCLSRTVSNLTDASLYDEVDCAKNVEVCVNTGLLIDERKKALRKNLPAKKVRFSASRPTVHVLRVWAFAARQARPGHWERCARDRERFQRRIADVDMAVSWVLKPEHRARVMFQRIRPWWNAERRRELAEKKREDEENRMKQLAEVTLNDTEDEQVNQSVEGSECAETKKQCEIVDNESGERKLGCEVSDNEGGERELSCEVSDNECGERKNGCDVSDNESGERKIECEVLDNESGETTIESKISGTDYEETKNECEKSNNRCGERKNTCEEGDNKCGDINNGCEIVPKNNELNAQTSLMEWNDADAIATIERKCERFDTDEVLPCMLRCDSGLVSKDECLKHT